MPKIPLTRIAAFRPFPAFLEANGCDVVRHLRSFGIAAENLAEDENLVPLPLAGEFVDQVAKREGIARLGLEEAMESSAPSDDLAESICQSVRAGFGAAVPAIDKVAQMAGTSVSTLQRRLREQGTSYQGLVDRVRFEKARKLLADGRLPIAEIAQRLDYSDAANFTHAFRRWTGETPLATRRRMQEGDPAGSRA